MSGCRRLTLVAASLAVAGGFALALTASTHTPPFLEPDGRVTPGSLAEERRVELGGWPQYVLLRGRDARAPFLLVLHGGPGSSEMPFFRLFDAALEEHFLVVHWDQRGTGKSFGAELDPATLTLERMTRDLDELVEYLRRELGDRPLLLLGHSWGSLLGIEYASRHPQKLAAWVGVGQISDMVESERRGLAWALAEARSRGDADAVEALEAIGPPPYSWQTMLRQRPYVDRYGGAFVEPRSIPELVLVALQAPEVAWPDAVAFVRGQLLSLDALWPEIARYDAATAVPRLELPAYFFLGRHDRQVSAELAAEYVDALEAPRKEIVWFERSAHSPPFEEPEKFVAETLRVAREVGALASDR